MTIDFDDGHGLCPRCGGEGDLHGGAEISDETGPITPRFYRELWRCRDEQGCGARWWEQFTYRGRTLLVPAAEQANGAGRPEVPA